MSSFKYKTSFNQFIIGSCRIGKDFSKNPNLFNYLSNSSLDSLETLIPGDLELNKNIDLIATAFNAAVVNQFNKNGDGINTETALAIKDYFVHKPTNIEHKKEKVVGHIVSSAFSSYEDNQLISDEAAAEKKDPFNIALGAVVYRTVNKAFANMLENEDDEYEVSISASWELGFNDYYISVGSNSMSDSEIITDKEQIKEFEKHLRSNGGPGQLDDGTKVNRLIVGDIFPLGIGYTVNPAADVSGLYVRNKDKPKEELEEQEVELAENFNKKYSQNEKNTVIQKEEESYSTMETQEIINKLEEVADSQKIAFSEEAVASISKIVRDAIQQKSEEYVREQEALAKKEEELQRIETEQKALAEEVSQKLEQAEKELNELKTAAAEAKAKEIFNSRMEVVDSTFDLSEEDRVILAQELKDLDDTEESFATYQEKINVVWQHKNKEYIAKQEEEFQKKVDEAVAAKLAEASVQTESPKEEAKAEEVEVSEEEVEKALDNVEEADATITSNNGETSEKELSLKEKFQSIFNRENIKVTY